MAEKIRLGNDIGIDWSLIDEEGNPYNLEGRDVSVEIDVGEKKRYRIKELSVSGNTVSFVYWGKDQKYTGRCDLKFIENDGEREMVTFDTKGAFELVAHSWLIGGEPENERVQLSFVTVTSELNTRVGPKGDPAGFGEIQATVDALVGTPSVEVTTSGPDTAKNITFAFHNLKGEQGDIQNLTAEAIRNALGYTPADDSEVIKQIMTLAGRDIKGSGDVVVKRYDNSPTGVEPTMVLIQCPSNIFGTPITAIISVPSLGYYAHLVAQGNTAYIIDLTGDVLKFGLPEATYGYAISFGSLGSNEVYVTFTGGNGENFSVWVGDHATPGWGTELSSKIIRYYQKPSSGIPKTDLSSGVQTSLNKADTALQEHQSLAAYVNGGSYNSTTKKIELKHGATVLAEIDATAFIKDGMVNDVQITGGNLVISFNTDSGKEAITIPLTDIFNPENYYTKTATNELLNQKQPTIADLEEIRSGASKGNTAYQKPNSGIPASDLAVGVIPDVPEEATNAEVDALFE